MDIAAQARVLALAGVAFPQHRNEAIRQYLTNIEYVTTLGVMTKNNSINIPLTDEMKEFVSSQAGEGTLYSTPSEYIRDLIRHDRDRQQAAQLRQSILEGYNDMLENRTSKFSGNLKKDLKAFKSKKSS